MWRFARSCAPVVDKPPRRHDDDGGKSEVGEAELDVLRAQLARSKSLKQLSRMNTAHDGIA